jgi:Domain of unknown function (DUF5664)
MSDNVYGPFNMHDPLGIEEKPLNAFYPPNNVFPVDNALPVNLKFLENSTVKETNPKDAVGSDKLPMHLWPSSATAYGTIGLLNGMLKYGRSNWREAGIRPSIYVDACKRHLDDWFEGQECDPEDGVHNLSAALACLAILVDAIETGNMNDDRNFNGGSWRAARAKMEPEVKRLKELHSKRKEPKHYTIKDNK